jgi:hypothetical protein
MLTLQGGTHRGTCDGMTRRDMLRIGGLAMGGLSLPGLLRAEAEAAGSGTGTGARPSHKAVIMVFLAGGPSHIDSFDMKPDAPSEIRGEFRPIPTSVPGLSICEHLPRLARVMDKIALIRSISDCKDEHDATICLTGYSRSESQQVGGRPSLGAVVSRLQGPVDPAVPPFVGLSPKTLHAPWGNPGVPGYLGLTHAPFTPNGPELASMTLPKGFSRSRLEGRKTLLAAFDGLRRDIDASGTLDGLDTFTRRSFEILTSSRMVEALDLDREDPKLRARYGIGDMNPTDDGPPCCMDHFLMARRLVEAGVRVVTIGFGRWDYHSRNFPQSRLRMPKLDMGLSALIEDLHARGLDKDVSVVAWGEFGRSPRINAAGGRDHWAPVSMALLAGGGMKTGQVIGSTNRLGEVPKDRPVKMQEVFATLYHNLGLDPSTALPNQNNRPMAILDETRPIRELIG